MMIDRHVLTASRRWLPVRVILLMPLLLAFLAACGPGSGGGAGY